MNFAKHAPRKRLGSNKIRLLGQETTTFGGRADSFSRNMIPARGKEKGKADRKITIKRQGGRTPASKGEPPVEPGVIRVGGVEPCIIRLAGFVSSLFIFPPPYFLALSEAFRIQTLLQGCSKPAFPLRMSLQLRSPEVIRESLIDYIGESLGELPLKYF